MIQNKVCSVCGKSKVFGIMSWQCAVEALRTARNIKMTILFLLSLLLFGFDKIGTYMIEGTIELTFKNISDLCMATSTIVLILNFILSLYDRMVQCRNKSKKSNQKDLEQQTKLRN